MAKKESKALWRCDWQKLPSNAIGACFNADGIAWAWTVKPMIRGSEKRPSDLKWRGPEYGAGYTRIGMVVGKDFARKHWQESWLDRPKDA
jgi:hypothetical protein